MNNIVLAITDNECCQPNSVPEHCFDEMHDTAEKEIGSTVDFSVCHIWFKFLSFVHPNIWINIIN